MTLQTFVDFCRKIFKICLLSGTGTDLPDIVSVIWCLCLVFSYKRVPENMSWK